MHSPQAGTYIATFGVIPKVSGTASAHMHGSLLVAAQRSPEWDAQYGIEAQLVRIKLLESMR